jgi:hypothetical protein
MGTFSEASDHSLAGNCGSVLSDDFCSRGRAGTSSSLSSDQNAALFYDFKQDGDVVW